MAPLDGAIYANLMNVSLLGDQQSLGSVLDATLVPSGSGCADSSSTISPCRARVWLQATGSNVSLDGSSELDTTGFHLLAGTDGVVGDLFHLGVEAGAGQINATTPLGGNGQVRNVHAGVYAFVDTGPMVVSATVDALHSLYRVNRATGVGLASASPTGNTLSAGLQAAWPTALADRWWVTPKLGVLYEHQTMDGFHEGIATTNPLAASYAVTGLRNSTTSSQPYAALDFSRTIHTERVTYVPQLDLGYRYQARGPEFSNQVVAQDGTPFTLPGATTGRDVVGDVRARLTAKMDGSWDVYLSYYGLFASHLHDNALSVGVRKRI